MSTIGESPRYQLFSFIRLPSSFRPLFPLPLSYSVARLAILSPDLAKLANFGPPPAICNFDFTVYLAIFEPNPASTGQYFPAFPI